MPIKVAFLGAGNIAASHANAVRALGDRLNLIGVCDLNISLAENFCRTWSVPKAYKDLDTMIGEGKPDVVHVLLPPTAHCSAAKACLDRSCHIFIEKPFCLTSEECGQVLRSARATGRQVGVNHNLTYMPAVLKLIDGIRQRRLGALRQVTMMYNLPAPALDAGKHDHWMFREPQNIMLELGPHPLSVIHRLLGDVESASTAVAGKRILSHGGAFFDTWQSSLVCRRGTAQMVLSLGNTFLSTWVHVIGEDGEATVDLRGNTVRFSGNSPFIRTAPFRLGWGNGSALMSQSYSNLTAQFKGMFGIGPSYDMQMFSVNSSVAAFYDALEQGKTPPVDGVAGASVIRACEMVTDSAVEFTAKGETLASV